MSEVAQQEHESTTSGIMEEALVIRRSARASATHFVLCKGAKLRYLVELRRGARPLRRAVTSYGGKLGLLMRLLGHLPYCFMAYARLGFFAEVSLHPAVADMVPPGYAWNIIVGTYSNRQKLVLQCFAQDLNKPCRYVKVGNVHSEKQMQAEIAFLQHPPCYKLIALPKLLGAELRSYNCPFNMMVTEEFVGEKVPAVLTPEIYALYREIASETRIVDGSPMVRSHGDFAPWNIRRMGNRYMVFDWEFCGWRPRGYDLVHFLTIVGMNLEHKCFSDAFDAALLTVQTYEPEISPDKADFRREFCELMQFDMEQGT